MDLRVFNLAKRAKELFQSASYDLALQFMDRAFALANNPNDKIDVLFDMAIMYDELEEDDKALECYKEILELDSFESSALYGMAMINEKMTKFDLAEKYYKKCIEIDPYYDRAYFFLANLYDITKQYDKAIDYYLMAMELSPDDIMIYNNLGAIYENMDRCQDAMLMLDKAIELDDTYFRPFFNKAVVYGKQKEYNLAIKYYLMSIEKNSAYNNNYLNMSALYIDQNRLIEALDILNRGIKNADDKAYLYYNKACVAMKMHDSSLALEGLEMAISLDSSLKEYSRTDIDFESLRDDPSFIKLTGEDDDFFEKRRRDKRYGQGGRNIV